MPELTRIGGDERRVVGGLDVGQAKADDGGDDDQLDHHDHAVEPRGFGNAAHEQDGQRENDEHGRQVGQAMHGLAIRHAHHLERRGHEAGINMNAPSLQQRAHVARPADRHGRSADRIFEHQIPADDPARQFAQRRIGIDIGTPCRGDHARKLAVAQPGKGAGDGGHRE